MRASEHEGGSSEAQLDEMRSRVLELETENRSQLAQMDALQHKLAAGGTA